MARTDAATVQSILLDDYDTSNSPSLTVFINTASTLVDKIHTNDSGGLLSDADLTTIEAWLAAHLYVLSDQKYQQKSTGGASGGFQGQTAMNFDYSPYGQTAKLLDVTGYLAKLNKAERPKASASWLGKPPSEQIDYEDRD